MLEGHDHVHVELLSAAKSKPGVVASEAKSWLVRILLRNSSTFLADACKSPRIMGSVPPSFRKWLVSKKASTRFNGPAGMD